ncbi:hypothetical protein GPECTOR_3g156 [Gonium pectorale]|uniref:Uncharacterized protein n=1 Tax=Gonium pectorale TaxID=33097 RepID=A0A150GYT8_GONPE|nr:hypothetical protein GPECTOR_3g156 [Gonium pectorale]|eukprot:KXZ54991.1 hypothetical protein GPECTOR_3g156 [Gonium pectorale]
MVTSFQDALRGVVRLASSPGKAPRVRNVQKATNKLLVVAAKYPDLCFEVETREQLLSTRVATTNDSVHALPGIDLYKAKEMMYMIVQDEEVMLELSRKIQDTLPAAMHSAETLALACLMAAEQLGGDAPSASLLAEAGPELLQVQRLGALLEEFRLIRKTIKAQTAAVMEEVKAIAKEAITKEALAEKAIAEEAITEEAIAAANNDDQQQEDGDDNDVGADGADGVILVSLLQCFSTPA